MSRTFVLIVCALALGLGASRVEATPIVLTYASPEMVGWYAPPQPADEADEVDYISILIGLAAGGSSTVDSRFYSRIDSELGGPFPTPMVPGFHKDDSGTRTTIDVSGFTYLIGKYDGDKAGGLVWLVAGLSGPVEIPALWGKPGGGSEHELSHYTLFKGASVPDGGATLVLLGGALMALVALRRRFDA